MAKALDQMLSGLASNQRSSFLVPRNGQLPQSDAALAAPSDECTYLVGCGTRLSGPKKQF